MLCDWRIKLLVRVCAVLMHPLCRCARTVPKLTARIPRSANASPSARMPVVARGLRCTSTRGKTSDCTCLHVVGASPGCRQCRELPAGPADAAMPRRVCIMPRRSCCYVSLSRGLLTASLSIIVLDWYCCRRMAALPSVQCGAEGEYHTRPLSYMHNSTAHATPADLIVPREPPA